MTVQGMWKVWFCCKEKKSKNQEEVLARHIKERVTKKKMGNKGKTLECNHFDDEKHNNVFFDASGTSCYSYSGKLKLMRKL